MCLFSNLSCKLWVRGGGGGKANYQALRILAGFSLRGSLQIVCFVMFSWGQALLWILSRN